MSSPSTSRVHPGPVGVLIMPTRYRRVTWRSQAGVVWVASRHDLRPRCPRISRGLRPDDLARLRREYGDHGLDLPDLEPDPVSMFRRWLDDTMAAGLHEPNAMVVATVGAGRPAVDARGAAQGPRRAGLRVLHEPRLPQGAARSRPTRRVSLLFPWHDLQRQVRVEGTASRVSAEENEAYFAGRPRESQLGAWASPQSQVVACRSALDERYGGVLVAVRRRSTPYPCRRSGAASSSPPTSVEFWQGRKGRHARPAPLPPHPRRPSAPWMVERLAP